MFKSLLIANRGEVAVRVVRACRDLGLRAVVVHDDADADALHVRLADRAYPLRSPLGYRAADELVEIALASGAEAVHPGYGFLAESPAFARRCVEAGIAFVGPGADCLERVGDKIGAAAIVAAAGLPTTRCSSRAFGPGDEEALAAEADALGYPLVIKTAAGGRGRGTLVVRRPERLAAAVERSRAAALAVFDDPRLFLEAAVLPSRYLEVTVLSDGRGGRVHFGERDASIQRNNLKLITEAPAPGLSPELRERIWAMALQAAEALGCEGLCNVELVLDGAGQPFFTEVKLRLPIEHPVAELISGVDQVCAQIRVAAGEPLPLAQADIRLHGVAVQCRVNAEDPARGFLPAPGRLAGLRSPGGPGVRLDSHAFAGWELPLRYDPLLAKLAVWGPDRASCLGRLRRALAELVVEGLPTNLPLIRQVVDDPRFVAGDYTTEFGRHPAPVGSRPDDLADLAAVAALAHLLAGRPRPASQPPAFTTGWHHGSRELPG